MRKILYITTNLQGSGGVARILSVKVNYLIKKYNNQIFIIETNKIGDDFFYDFDETITFNYIKTKNLIKYKRELNVWIGKINPDIIVNCDNGLKGSLLSYLVSNKKPLIYERHCSRNIAVAGFIDQIKLKLSNLLLQFHIDKYSYFIVLNSDEAKNWKSENIKVVPNPLWFLEQKNRTHFNNKTALAVGRHAYEKGYDNLIGIWKCVIKIHPDWVLKIYGKKDKNIDLESLVVNQHLENNIMFFDSVKDVDEIYAQGSMLLSTSISESFGLSIIEAMAFGLPVIAFYKALGARSTIRNNQNGFLIKEENIDEYVKKIDFLIKNEEIRNKMGVKAKQSVSQFSIVDIMNCWNELFSSL